MAWIKKSKGMQTLTHLVATRTAGDVYVQRSGRTVELLVVGLVTVDQTHGFTALVLPPGYRPNRSRIIPQAIHLTTASTAGQRTIIGPSGDVRFFGVDGQSPIYLQCTFFTDDPIPTGGA